ncbi:MAG: aminotransferase class V-fold PLP-dependent enzyme, partial [bacterium]|nr:aminotransferase class V-fold PLP-dependent enzyme [bacterium]
ANVSPWVMAAADAGAVIRKVAINAEDCTLDLADFHAKLNDRTKLVAIGAASNSVGSINPIQEICQAAKEVGALSFVDAVHFAPHQSIDVSEIGCDFLACSVYKFFGPHVGVLWGKRPLLESLTAYKVRPATNDLPGRWMTGTQNHECIAGSLAAVEYLADLGRVLASDSDLSRRAALKAAFEGISFYESELIQQLIAGLKKNDDITIFGITDPDRRDERLPTISIRHAKKPPTELANYLGEHGAFVWHGHYYALELSEALGVEPEGMVRIGIAHYNTPAEIDRLLELLSDVS